MDTHHLEAFALAKDRVKALEQFIPGTEDYFFHAALVAEQAGNFAEVRSILDQWNKRVGETTRFQELRNRLTLLDYDRKPDEAREYLRYHLGLDFSHERDVEGRPTDHPTRLDAALVSRQAIRQLGYNHSNSSDHSGFTDAAIDWLIDEPHDGDRLRNLLRRLTRPDYAKLVDLVVAELKDKRSSGFGSIPIHTLLLQDQLDKLGKARPSLLTDDAFVNAYLVKLQPGPDVDWQNDATAREAYLDRLWGFVKGLAPRFNPLKAHVLFHRLDHDRRLGKLEKDRFLEYVKLPRQVSYANASYLKQFSHDDRPFGLGQDFRGLTLHGVVSDDEELVRDCLSRLFLDAKDSKPFDTWMSETFLKQVFATTKMLAGVGDMERWFSMVNDAAYCQALKDKVELEFARTNKTYFRADDPVTLEVDVKNVPTLTAKVFEINSLNYFLANGRDVDTSIDLDGLVASEEQTYTYTEAPMRRVRRTFPFPTLGRPGVYIVELIGGGISSRALVRKGRARYVERLGAAGHVFTVLDEERNIVTGASIWLAGRELTAQADGSITVPFSTHPGRQTILLRTGAVTTLEAFHHQAESYRLAAGLYVDRESLLKKKEAQLVIRASLELNGWPVSLKLLEEPVLAIQSTDRDGVSSSQEVRDLKLREDGETVHTFQVPEKLASMSFTLRGKVKNLSQGTRVDVADSSAVTLNGIDADAAIDDLHLARAADGYVLYHLGKSGEVRAGSAITVRLQHRDLVPGLDFTLQTDAAGRIELGHLRDIVSLCANAPTGVSETWTLPGDRVRPTPSIHVRAGEPFRVPLPEVAPLGGVRFPDAFGKAARETGVERADASLLERIGQTFLRDHFSALSRKGGYLEVAGLPAGTFDLLLKREGVSITVRSVPGEDRAGWVAGEKRHAERRNARPLQVMAVTAGDRELAITLGNPGERTRVHVFGTRFVPAFSAYETFCRGSVPGGRAVELFKAQSSFVSGRDIGDEYRYILERKQLGAFAGNMLTRPGVLLNPWAVRGTETATQEAQAGGAYAASPAPSMAAPAPQPMEEPAGPSATGHFANLDFLSHGCATALNLAPDEKGVVRLPRATFAHANTLRVVAVDTVSTVVRDVLLPEVQTPHEDLRLRLSLDADGHFSEKKQITVLSPGQPLEIADITTSTTEVYDTLARVYRLYATLSNDTQLAAFSFILRWPKLPDEEKRAKYSEYACHELSFFLSKKDPEFFARVVKPYLTNKLHKTFMDRYLLGDELSGFRRPWAFGRLNIVERILLSQRVDDEGEPVARHARDLCDLLPRDLERFNFLFGSAIQGSALEAGDALGIRAQTELARNDALLQLKDSFGGAGMQAPMAEAGMLSIASRSAPAAKPMAAGRAAGPRREEQKKSKARSRDVEKEIAYDEECEAPAGGDFDAGERDVRSREAMRQFYQKLDKTQEWAENNWWHLTIEQQGPELITINPFWKDFANHRKQGRQPAGPFLSRNLAYASRNFAEMMCALSVLDLPFDAQRPTVAFEGAKMKLSGAGVSVAWHKEIKPVEPSTERVPVLVSQNYFRDDDRTRWENGESVDKYVEGELLVNVVYTAQVVLTNPTSTIQKLELLLQIPQGSCPVRSGFVTHGRHVELSSYATESIEYSFYFPAPGTFPHFPVHVAKNEQLIASAPPSRLKVVRELSTVDKTSWAWLSQHGKAGEVLAWMETNNLDRLAVADSDGELGLDKIAWRMKERGFYEKCIALLSKRHVWNPTLWAYAVHHADLPNMRELLLHRDDFLDRCGPWLDSKVVTIDAVERKRYQHLEYAPLVNARTGKLGARRTILNDRFGQQYSALMSALRYKKTPSDPEKLTVAYYLFLQDRVGDALEAVDGLDRGKLDSQLQYDYLKLYAEFFRERPNVAREVALRYQDFPVDRWRDLFRNAMAQLEELAGGAAKVVDDKDRDQRQARLASTEPDFDFTVEKKTVTVNLQNLSALRVNYYRMDIELLFSRQPFVQQQSSQFSFIKPNRTDEVKVPAGSRSVQLELPAEFSGANVIVELVAEGKRKSQACYAHELSLQLVESYGQVRVSHQTVGKPLPKTYVKVYGRMKGGEVKFYKDGYTDLRGVFDYTSLSTNELDYVDRFSLLILNAQHGAVIREAVPPKR